MLVPGTQGRCVVSMQARALLQQGLGVATPLVVQLRQRCAPQLTPPAQDGVALPLEYFHNWSSVGMPELLYAMSLVQYEA